MYGKSSCKFGIFVFNIYVYCLIRENTYLIISVNSNFYSNYCVIFVIIYFIVLFRYVKVLFCK